MYKQLTETERLSIETGLNNNVSVKGSLRISIVPCHRSPGRSNGIVCSSLMSTIKTNVATKPTVANGTPAVTRIASVNAEDVLAAISPVHPS